MQELSLTDSFFALLHKAVFATDRHANALLIKENSTFSDFLILNTLLRCEDLSQQNIALFLNLTPAAVSRHIDILVKRELAQRTEDPRSRRANRITLTQKGKTEIARMQKVLRKGFKNNIAVLSEKEMKSVCRVLEVLLKSFTNKTA